MNTSMAIMPARPTGADILAIVAGADLAESTRRKYRAALSRFLEAGGDPLDASSLAGCAEGLPASSRAQLKAAVKLYSNALLDELKARADPDNVDFVRAAEHRTEALQNAIRGNGSKGQKAHTWLTRVEVIALLDSSGDDLKGRRDRLALGLLVAAGLRRAEAVALTFDDVKLQPVRGKLRTVLDVQGKGSKRRVVPISDGLANAIDGWAAVAGHIHRAERGYLCRLLRHLPDVCFPRSAEHAEKGCSLSSTRPQRALRWDMGNHQKDLFTRQRGAPSGPAVRGGTWRGEPLGRYVAAQSCACLNRGLVVEWQSAAYCSRRKPLRIRPARQRDLKACGALDHSYTTDCVWQVETREENGVWAITFRVARLPREIRVEYPRWDESLIAGWQRRDGFLVADEEGCVCGYVALTAQAEHGIGWIGDLVVDRPWRRQGVGTALLRAAAQWGCDNSLPRLVVEVQTKNYPAIRFCQSRGLAFCGYNDHHWPSQDIALFFGGSLR